MTGAAGFVGINVARALAARGHAVLGFDHRDPDGPARAYVGEPGRWVRGDVQDAEAVGRAREWHEAEVVVHAAAVTATTPAWERERARAVLAVNLLGTVTALQAAHAAGARRVLIVSSASALRPAQRRRRPRPGGGAGRAGRSLRHLQARGRDGGSPAGRAPCDRGGHGAPRAAVRPDVAAEP